jgi:peptide/nickel transport system permease protein
VLGEAARPVRRRGREALVAVARTTSGLVGLVLVSVFVLAGLAGAVVLLAPGLEHLWTDQNLARQLLPPGSEGHLLGTDELGRDLLWRLLAALGLSLLLGVTVTLVVIATGVCLGGIAGYFGGERDRRISAAIDLTWGFPLVLAAVVIAGMLGKGAPAVGVAATLVAWAGVARVVRAQVAGLRHREYVEAARMLGTPQWLILRRHILPGLTGTVLVFSSYYLGLTIITEASLSYVGLGVQAPTPSLGGMIARGRDFWSRSIWPALVPGIAIALVILGLNLLGDALRDLGRARRRNR